MTVCGYSQEGFQLTDNNQAKISFQLINNLIFIPVKVNGVSMTFLLDTGVEETILFSLEETDTVPFFNVNKVKLRGLGGDESIEALSSSENRVEIAKNLVDTNHTILIVLNEEINFSSSLGIPVNGIMGYHFFKNNCVKIDYEKEQLFVYKEHAKVVKKIKRKYTAVPISIKNNKPYLQGNFSLANSNEFSGKLLIDTGNSDALWLFENQSDKIQIPRANFEDYLGKGFSGDIHGKRAKINRFQLNEFVFEKPYVAFPDYNSIKNVTMVQSRIGSVGGEILQRFTVVFDYRNNELFIRKNKNYSKPFSFNMSGLEINHAGRQWVQETLTVNTYINVGGDESHYQKKENPVKFNFVLKPIYKIVNVREDSPGALAGLKKDDVIVSINRKPASTYTLQSINELLKSEDGKKILFEVNRNGKYVKLILQLKSIL
jgi:hypothetical protein